MWQSNAEQNFQNFSLQKETSRTSSTLGFQYVKVCDFEFFESARAKCRAEFSKFSAPQETLRTSGNLGFLYLTNLSWYFFYFCKNPPKAMKSPFLGQKLFCRACNARIHDLNRTGKIRVVYPHFSYKKIIYIYILL